MKKLVVIIIIFFVNLSSCEDVVDVDLNEAPPRLVIDAGIDWLKNTSGNEQEIKLSLSAPFFQDGIQPANGAIVFINDASGNTFNFIEEGTTGIYKNTTFLPVIDGTYLLFINYNNENYTATETLKSVTPIDFVEQRNDGGFLGEDIELKAFYTDPVNEENFYFFEFEPNIPILSTLEVYEDRFTNGNQIFGFYTDEDLEIGDQVTISNRGISERFYNFMFTLLQQGSEDSGGPFETQPATVRGNCINTTDSNNFPFGYFRLSEVDQLTYTIQ